MNTDNARTVLAFVLPGGMANIVLSKDVQETATNTANVNQIKRLDGVAAARKAGKEVIAALHSSWNVKMEKIMT